MDIVLVAGLWLDSSAWDAVVERLGSMGHRADAVALPGQGAPPATASLEDQRSAVVAAVDACDGPVMVVGHSAAGTLAWLAADSRPDKVARVVMIGGFTSGDGATYADFFPIEDGLMAFPGWEPFEGPDSADLDEVQRADFAARAVPVSGAVATAAVHLADERRYGIPVSLICPEYSPEQAKGWIEGGEVPELARAESVEYVNIDSGHWPMVTRPDELAKLIDELAT